MARIMVVDDEAEGAEAFCRLLRRGGHDAVRVADAREALARLAAVSPDIVVLDPLAARGGGMEFLQVLRNYYRVPLIPVILLTPLGDGNHIRRATQLGVKRILLKGDSDPAELLACVNELSAPPGQDLSSISARASLNG